MANETDQLLDHEYDGIREYDNPTPGWWHVIFMCSVLFAVVYYVFWEYSPLAYSAQEAWKQRETADFKAIFGSYGELKPDEATILKLRSDEKLMAVADGIFQANCATCHLSDGRGQTGVNLTDDSYKNVKVVTDVFSVITNGANNGAMPAWGNRLSQNERVIIASYAARLRGTKPANGKGPEGVVIPPWPETPGR